MFLVQKVLVLKLVFIPTSKASSRGICRDCSRCIYSQKRFLGAKISNSPIETIQITDIAASGEQTRILGAREAFG